MTYISLLHKSLLNNYICQLTAIHYDNNPHQARLSTQLPLISKNQYYYKIHALYYLSVYLDRIECYLLHIVNISKISAKLMSLLATKFRHKR